MILYVLCVFIKIKLNNDLNPRNGWYRAMPYKGSNNQYYLTVFLASYIIDNYNITCHTYDIYGIGSRTDIASYSVDYHGAFTATISGDINTYINNNIGFALNLSFYKK